MEFVIKNEKKTQHSNCRVEIFLIETYKYVKMANHKTSYWRKALHLIDCIVCKQFSTLNHFKWCFFFLEISLSKIIHSSKNYCVFFGLSKYTNRTIINIIICVWFFFFVNFIFFKKNSKNKMFFFPIDCFFFLLVVLLLRIRISYFNLPNKRLIGRWKKENEMNL